MPRVAGAQQLQLETPPVDAPRASGEPPRDPAKPGTQPVRPMAKARATVKGTATKPSSAQLLQTPGALLTRSHLRQLGLERRAIDAVFRVLPTVALPGYSRPMIRVEQYLELVDQYTYRDDRVRPCHA